MLVFIGGTMIITGNPQTGLAHELEKIYPYAEFCSRTNGYELTSLNDQKRFVEQAVKHDVIIINSALWRFTQTVLLDLVYKALVNANKQAHIVCIGSTTDRVKKGGSWLYNAEKKALRDYANTLGLTGVWSNKPKISLISFGTLSNNQHKHPDRQCLDTAQAAEYIKWLIDQPKHVNINEISIDPMQDQYWYKDE